jgi:hypothetical protein
MDSIVIEGFPAVPVTKTDQQPLSTVPTTIPTAAAAAAAATTTAAAAAANSSS